MRTTKKKSISGEAVQLGFELCEQHATPPSIPSIPNPPTIEPSVFTVSDLTRQVRDLLEDRIGTVWVEGEVTNLRKQSSGHQYFSLKDATAQISCVLFARTPTRLELRDGLQVELRGDITVYEARGQYQLIVREGRQRGAGALHAKFEALKKKLAAEGLFDRKRPLPRFPHRIGVITSPTGAAIRDFLNVLHRRAPNIEVIILPVRVQGVGAAAEIAAAVKELSLPFPPLPRVDVIVITRGGGSIEDLWEFNEEAVARAVAASEIPVVSAVGHEVDFTICDFVADFRAPTPSAAAEILAADIAGVLEQIARDERLFIREMQRTLDAANQRTDYLTERLVQNTTTAWQHLDTRLIRYALQLDPRRYHAELRQATTRLNHANERLGAAAQIQWQKRASRLDTLEARVQLLNPLATLARGFTITCDENGKTLLSASEARVGQRITTLMSDGKIVSRVEQDT